MMGPDERNFVDERTKARRRRDYRCRRGLGDASVRSDLFIRLRFVRETAFVGCPCSQSSLSNRDSLGGG